MLLTWHISVFLVLVIYLFFPPHVFVLNFCSYTNGSHTLRPGKSAGCSEYQKHLDDDRQQFAGPQTRESMCQRSHLSHGPSNKILGLRTHFEK